MATSELVQVRPTAAFYDCLLTPRLNFHSEHYREQIVGAVEGVLRVVGDICLFLMRLRSMAVHCPTSDNS